ncbi:GOLPH3/VPS74 family protein [Nonomuraea jiangxiensis]|uniref:Golgi phosphoprotein 3 (GPP34) n=1 Tax=Nonomuraea jiangxiensis TaxID=633440 RepID=A0A1G9QY60_9ACTN|nr:GPP34 family phosphoprotein [Nonomuraea jiangxiensis]SDM15958.1 Golgi phosphoprotein 3 (GPP34) [Nonomuraea jiangxiensis]
MLIVEDLMLLMLDDEKGTVARAGALNYSLGGAVLVELALLGRIEADEDRAGLNGPEVLAVGDGPLPDPLLQSAYDEIAQKPQGIQALILSIGAGLQEPVLDRLVERGLIRRESKRVLGVFRTTTWPAEDTRHEAELRRVIGAVLVDGESPDARTAAMIALLSSSGTLPALRPAFPWSDEVRRRAKELEDGNWGATAVTTAMARNAARIAATAATSAAVSVAVFTAIT